MNDAGLPEKYYIRCDLLEKELQKLNCFTQILSQWKQEGLLLCDRGSLWCRRVIDPEQSKEKAPVYVLVASGEAMDAEQDPLPEENARDNEVEKQEETFLSDGDMLIPDDEEEEDNQDEDDEDDNNGTWNDLVTDDNEEDKDDDDTWNDLVMDEDLRDLDFDLEDENDDDDEADEDEDED